MKCNFKNENNGNAKLTNEQIEQLRKEWDPEQWTLRTMAAKWGISHSQVRRIILKIQR